MRFSRKKYNHPCYNHPSFTLARFLVPTFCFGPQPAARIFEYKNTHIQYTLNKIVYKKYEYLILIEMSENFSNVATEAKRVNAKALGEVY